MEERLCLKIRGIVQGVGFRPFVHKLVQSYNFSGFIKNTSSGVELELEGERQKLEEFVRVLPEKAPKLAVIESMEYEYSCNLIGYKGFEIRSSKRESVRDTLISPDICICDDCLKELRDKTDRRYKYPFINCTNCGPRFTIIEDVPYDRGKTSMKSFPMCPDCEREYHDIEDRRYHAQPDCCDKCGPHVSYYDEQGKMVIGDGIELGRQALKDGKIVAIKGLGGFHLACKWDEKLLVQELRRRKQRDEKPFALMCRDVECVRKVCKLSEAEERLLTSSARPIILLEKKQKGLDYLSNNNFLGIMLPYTPLHYLLFGDDIDMLVMTSANLSDTPIMFKNSEVLEKLHGIADGFVLHDREIQTRCDDSLCWELDGKEYFARRSRGYVPFPIKCDWELESILACGAEQKASFCLSKGSYIFQSQHIGDLKNMETLENYTQQIRHFQRLFDINPRAVVCDMHPDYMSTEYAQSLDLPLIQVQHHMSHLASCVADNGLKGDIIGLVWDGTGWGLDGTSWGGECLIGSYENFQRFGHIKTIPLIGGDRATKELERVSFALLNEAGLDTEHIKNADAYRAMLNAGLNCPLSSGMGRLFDGVAAILDIKTKASYEGQGAVLLEAAAGDDDGIYPVVLEGEPLVFDWREMIRAIVHDKNAGLDRGAIAARFMNTLMRMAVEMAEAARKETGLDRVCLSGGSFQNMYIMKRLPKALEKVGFKVYHHSRVSTNDEGIALGQLMIANAMLRKQ